MIRQLNWNIGGPSGALPKDTPLAVDFYSDAAQPERPYYAGIVEEDGRFIIRLDGPDPVNGTGTNLTIIAPGCKPFYQRGIMQPGEQPVGIALEAGPNPFRKTPSKPTRAQLCGVKLSFQGYTVPTEQYGSLPWFPPALGWLDLPADRRTAYAVHRAAGDTHVNLTLSGQYREPRQAYENVAGRDFSKDLPLLHDRIAEAVSEGFLVLLMLAGDGQGSGPGYNDPVGWTYGYQWLMDNFERVYRGLEDLAPWIAWCPGYDGVVPGWATSPIYQYPSEVDKWLLHARSIVGSEGALALELSAGYPDWGGSAGNYTTPAGQGLDTVMSEFPEPLEANWDQVWQIVGRLNRPYIRPANQPIWDDPHPPYYLAPSTPRGPFLYVAWEYDTYGWVRGMSVNEVNGHRAYLKALGCELVG